jgi:RNA polymerase sigma-70 factor (ECF subfamily)
MAAIDDRSPSAPSATHSAADDDLVAVDEVLRGNREMFEVIVRHHNARLYRVGMAYLRDHARAEDAMQNAYIHAFLHLQRFDRHAAFGTWLTWIMINECLMMLRRDKGHPSEPLDDSDEAHAAVEAVASDAVQITEMKTLLENAIGALPQNYRAVYVLREVQQLTTAETAAALGISEESVKVLLHRARARLKDVLLKSAAAVELFPYPAEYCDPMT